MFYFDPTLESLRNFYLSPVMAWVMVSILLFLCVALFTSYGKKTKFFIAFELVYEKVYAFYSDILWDDASQKIRVYIATLFLVILFANLSWVLLDFVAPIFGQKENSDFVLSQYIISPTSDMQFNMALALFSTLLLLYVQFGTLGVKKFFYNYFPVWGKGYVEVEQWKMWKILYYPISAFAKVADIIISLFLGFLDIVGLFAKVISLSFRLFWNMTSGTILLGMLLVGVSSVSETVTSFIGGINFPVVVPMIVYAQGLLVALIQAMVFPLLVAIFIRMALMEE